MRHLDRVGIRPKITRYALSALLGGAVTTMACAPSMSRSAEFSYPAEGCITRTVSGSRSADLDLGEFGKKTILSKEELTYVPGDKVRLVIERKKGYSIALNAIDGGHTKLFAEMDAIDDVFKALGAKTIFTDGHIGLYDTNARTRKIGTCG